MKKIITPTKKIIALISTLASSLFFSTTTSAQATIIYNEKFDGDSTALPIGWSTHGNAWHVESNNYSTGYVGASGLVNVVIRNDSATGNYDLISKSVSTVGYNSINVLWGTRLTTNFPTTGSSITGLYWSNDNGATWNTISYTENTNNSIWSLDNAGVPIALPASANNQPSIMFKWTASIVNGSQGTYRIDDFTVGGIVGVGIAENSLLISSAEIFPNPSIGDSKLILHTSKNLTASIDVFNMLGQETGSLPEVAVVAGSSSIALDEKLFPANGIYFIRIKTGDEIKTIRFIEN